MKLELPPKTDPVLGGNSISFIPGLQFLEPLKELKESLEHTIDEQIMQGRLTL
tara:strand:- start:259 stop:417 length:159 start_codon:yes stop_codon:yes gene_type:complete